MRVFGWPLLVFCLLLVGCGGGGDDSTASATTPTTPQALIIKSKVIIADFVNNQYGIEFDASETTNINQIDSITWSFGDGATKTFTQSDVMKGLKTTYQYAHAGQYTVKLTVKYQQFRESVSFYNFDIKSPSLYWMLTPSSGGLIATANICATCVKNAVTYSYNWGDGTAITTSKFESGDDLVVRHKYANAGTYTVNVTIMDSLNNRFSASQQLDIREKGLISASSTSASIGQKVTFLVSDVLNDIKSVIWTMVNSTAVITRKIDETIEWIFNQAGEQVIQAELKDSQGETVSTIEQKMQILPVCKEWQTRQDYVCIDKPVLVKTVSPVVFGSLSKTTITVEGENFPSTVMFSLDDVICDSPSNVTVTRFTQTCVASTAGSKKLVLYDKLGGVEIVEKILTVIPKVINKIGTGLLNDTGVTFCMRKINVDHACDADGLGDWFGLNQDGELGRDLLATDGHLTKIGGGISGFDFTKISATGEKLPANAKVWSCVLDNQTGFMWEVKTYDRGVHYEGDSYQWYNPDISTNGGFEGAVNNGKNTYAFIQTVNQQGLCGYNDWRLPNRQELHSIIDYGHEPDPLTNVRSHIDKVYFFERTHNFYLTSASNADKPAEVWLVSFEEARDYSALKTSTVSVRLVRSDQ